MTPPVISQLFIYPIKSCGGVSLEEATIVDRGFRYDRRWMITNEKGEFLTQRSHPRLALAKIELRRDGFLISAATFGSVHTPAEIREGTPVTVEVWENHVLALRGKSEIEEWFSTLLGEPCWVVHMPEGSTRPLRPDYALHGEHIAFSDAFPFLLLSEGSLENLNRRLSRQLPMNRFRPNIVVSGCRAHAEDTWKEIRIGSVPFRVAKPCARCVTTTVDQDTGMKTDEPLRALATYRTVNGDVIFGQNIVHRSNGILHTGDVIEILSGGNL